MDNKRIKEIEEKAEIRIITVNDERICQGDILKDVEFIEKIVEINDDEIEIFKIIFPYVVVLTQDCDLQQDNNKKKDKKELFSVIVAPLYNIEHFYNGEHLSEINMKGSDELFKSETRRDILLENNTPRYHFIKFPKGLPIVNSIIDFKQYFTVNVDYLKEHKINNFICQIDILYRENLLQRFSNFLSRIGLPNPEIKK